MQGRGKRDIPKKTRRRAASSGAIPTSENPAATPSGIEPGAPWWEASGLAIAPPRPQYGVRDRWCQQILTKPFCSHHCRHSHALDQCVAYSDAACTYTLFTGRVISLVVQGRIIGLRESRRWKIAYRGFFFLLENK
ncbi:hypothetical protein PR048_022588 [Dryococelus australis]|uniref:Uncharacterized protein n=1 Tax=Dryococelus australis TaxID=614101 RepID=A0ABQ9H1P4_9NEOP|nr:hypothetical protein PR048_022588 [Dryococelus australis]